MLKENDRVVELEVITETGNQEKAGAALDLRAAGRASRVWPQRLGMTDYHIHSLLQRLCMTIRGIPAGPSHNSVTIHSPYNQHQFFYLLVSMAISVRLYHYSPNIRDLADPSVFPFNQKKVTSFFSRQLDLCQ